MADEELRAAACKAEERLDALEQALFKERDELKAKVAELTKSEERLRYQVMHLVRALEARDEAARRAVELAGSPGSSSGADGGKEALREKLASVLIGSYYLSEEEEKSLGCH